MHKLQIGKCRPIPPAEYIMGHAALYAYPINPVFFKKPKPVTKRESVKNKK